MNDEYYDIQAWPERCRLEITFRGMWTTSVADRFRTDLHADLRRMRAAGVTDDRVIVLADMTGLSILSAILTPVFGRFATEEAGVAAMVAVAFSSVMSLMQLRRLTAGQDQFAFFSNREDAIHCLDRYEESRP
ncbi:hypothetical protein ACFSC3_15810 [Sphingomonas floccifaciens]|uniref:STAS domain-containing protein n=1 Tax=Sphingomonas floccifaciens TaxID=1844115 RepID=A0ABW4NHK5_9SPHN